MRKLFLPLLFWAIFCACLFLAIRAYALDVKGNLDVRGYSGADVSINIKEGTSPDTLLNYGKLYIKSTGRLWYKDDSGNDSEVSTSVRGHSLGSASDQTDVDTTGLKDGQGLQWNADTSKWIPCAFFTGVHVSVYPPAHNDTYVKATSTYADNHYLPYFATDPTKSLIGTWEYNSWLSASTVTTNQRFHIDLGTPKIVTRIYYENAHHIGGRTNVGVQNFTLQGSNTAASFADLTYATDTEWDNITTDPTVMAQHVAANTPDPRYITVTNTTAYRYYAFKFADNWGSTDYMGVRRVELQVWKGRQ